MASPRSQGRLQRPRVDTRWTDDCPRCGWHGYFEDFAATVDSGWTRMLCDDCNADLPADITADVTYFIISNT